MIAEVLPGIIDLSAAPAANDIADDELVALLEAMLFVLGDPASVERLAAAFELPVERIEAGLQQLEAQLAGRGIRLQRHRDAVQLVSLPAAADVIEAYLGLDLSAKLSRAALEALAIIAYRQPVTRPQIEAIRGVSSDGVLRTLLNRGLIEEVGRLEQAGRPILYGITFEFLQYFGLSSLDELPPLDGDVVAQLAARMGAAPETEGDTTVGAEDEGQE
ncbi:MAG: SMC-Scp complex subunit ScpB [Chloroflexi bacterium]|nr:SMC-Scp complex subunit ScpB [Chloroflexota bacterium]